MADEFHDPMRVQALSAEHRKAMAAARKVDAAKALSEVEDEKRARLANTKRLRALRLEAEEAERAAKAKKEAPTAKSPARKKKSAGG